MPAPHHKHEARKGEIMSLGQADSSQTGHESTNHKRMTENYEPLEAKRLLR